MATKRTTAPAVDVACAKCGAGDFDIIDKLIPRPGSGQHAVGFVRCTACRTAVGVVDLEVDARLSDLDDSVQVLGSDVSTIESNVRKIRKAQQG